MRKITVAVIIITLCLTACGSTPTCSNDVSNLFSDVGKIVESEIKFDEASAVNEKATLYDKYADIWHCLDNKGYDKAIDSIEAIKPKLSSETSSLTLDNWSTCFSKNFVIGLNRLNANKDITDSVFESQLKLKPEYIEKPVSIRYECDYVSNIMTNINKLTGLFDTTLIESGPEDEEVFERCLSATKQHDFIKGVIPIAHAVKGDESESLRALSTDGVDKGLLQIKNIFDPSADNSTSGYYDRTNDFIESNKLWSTDYVPVVAGSTVTIGTRNTFCTAYDANKNFVKYINSEVDSLSPSQYTIPQGVEYCRFICAVTGTTPSFPNYEGFYIYDGSYEYVSLDDVVADALARVDNPWHGKSAVAFGTSLTYRSKTTGGYLQYLATLSGISFDNQGIGGSMIFADDSNLDMLAAIKAYTGYSNKDLCIIEGFVNDWAHSALGSYTDTTETSACGCLYSAISHIYKQNPNIQIVVIIDHFTKGETWAPTKVINSQTQMSYYAEIKKLCNLYGIPVIDESESEISMFNPQYYLDHVHLNALGAEQSAEFIWSKLKHMSVKVKQDA